MATPQCCISEEEYNQDASLSPEAKKRMRQSEANSRNQTMFQIETAEYEAKQKYRETDESFLRTIYLDPSTVDYLERRARNCYHTKPDINSSAMLSCYREGDPLACECLVKEYIRETAIKKADFAEHVSKQYNHKE